MRQGEEQQPFVTAKWKFIATIPGLERGFTLLGLFCRAVRGTERVGMAGLVAWGPRQRMLG